MNNDNDFKSANFPEFRELPADGQHVQRNRNSDFIDNVTILNQSSFVVFCFGFQLSKMLDKTVQPNDCSFDAGETIGSMLDQNACFFDH